MCIRKQGEKTMNNTVEFKLAGNDANNEDLRAVLSSVSVRLEIDNIQNVQFFIENEEAQNLIEDYEKVLLHNKQTGVTMTFVEMVCRVMDRRFGSQYSSIVIIDEKEEPGMLDYPESGIMIFTLNKFLSLGYNAYKQQGINTEQLDDLAKHHNLEYELI